MTKLSATIITLNEERNIGDCIRSLGFADQIIVIDSESRDRTREIAKAAGAEVHTREFTNFSEQKNHAASMASGEWIFCVDADERVTRELAASIRKTAESNPPQNAFAVKRRSVIFGSPFRFSGTQNDRPVRLYRKGAAQYVQTIHETLQFEGALGNLSGVLDHYTLACARDYVRRLNQYTDFEAALHGTHHKFSAAVIARSFARFADIYGLKLGFLDGLPGLRYAIFSAWYECVKQCKTAERRNFK